MRACIDTWAVKARQALTANTYLKGEFIDYLLNSKLEGEYVIKKPYAKSDSFILIIPKRG